MNSRLAFICVVICILLFSNGIYSQEKTDADKDKTPANPVDSDKEETPQTQPAKLYDLSPVYKANMKWKEEVKIVIEQESTKYSSKSTISMTTDVQVAEVKDFKPTSLKFEDLKGKRVMEYQYDGTPFTNEDEFNEKPIKASIDESYCIKSIEVEEGSNFDKSILMVYPTGNLPGFMPPMKPIKVGDTWKTDKILALNLQLVFEEYNDKLNISKNTGEFKLESVEEKDKIEIATIIWQGKSTIQPPKGEEGTLILDWTDTIKFDLTNKRLISTDSSVTMGLAEQTNIKLNYKLTRTLKYENVSKAEKKPGVKPKTDEE